MKVRTLILLSIVLILTAACGIFNSPEDPGVIFGDGKVALQRLDSYRYVTEMAIEVSDTQSRTLSVDGKYISDPLSQEVRVVDAETQALYARWIRKADSYWIYDPAGDSWSSVSAAQAQQSLASISYIIPAELWSSVDSDALSEAEFVGNEEIGGRETAHYHATLDDAQQVVGGSQGETAGSVELDAWFDAESDVPIRTRVLASGAGAAGTTSIDITTTLHDLNSNDIAIQQPEEQLPTLGAGTTSRLQSLADGTELPVHPDAEQTLGAISNQIQPFVQQFDRISRSDNVAVQVYTAPVTVEELESYFMTTLEDEDWTFNQRASSGPNKEAVSMTFKRDANSAQVILIPLEDGRSLIITVLQ